MKKYIEIFTAGIITGIIVAVIICINTFKVIDIKQGEKGYLVKYRMFSNDWAYYYEK